MLTDIWKEVKGSDYLTTIEETVWRVVEAQEVMSTRILVDSLEEQEILEDLIEISEPALSNELALYHPLLYSSFRFPPLKHGSRFGRRFENSLWYDSISFGTVFAEKAFYQLNFLRDSAGYYDIVEVPLTVFSVDIKSNRGIDLTKRPFVKFKDAISSPVSYAVSQPLGTDMRSDDVEVFRYQSSRCPHQGVNVGLFTPKAFAHTTPNAKSFQSWHCHATKQRLEYVRTNVPESETMRFTLDEFMVDKKLPLLLG